MAATSAPISILRRPLPQTWGALAAFVLPIAVLASFALPADLGVWTGAVWMLRFHMAGVAAWATLAYLRDYRGIAPRALLLLATSQVLLLLVAALVLVAGTANLAAATESLWLPAGVGLLLWLVPTAWSGRSRVRRANGLGWLLTIALAVGMIHQAVGWMAVYHLRSHPADFAIDNLAARLRPNLMVRPAATLFYYHSLMSGYPDSPALFPWKLVSRPPRAITYFLLVQLESAALASALLAGLLLFHRARTQTPPILRLALASAGVGALAGGYHLFAQVQAVQPWGSTVFIELEILLVLLLAPAAYLTPPAALVSLVALLRPWSRRAGLAALLCLVLFWAPCLASWQATPALRLPGLSRVSEHAAPFIAAMESYLKATGFSGGVLDEGARDYFDTVPQRRFGAYPGRPFVFGRGGPDKPWTMWLPVPTGLSFRAETLLYRSDHDYTDDDGIRVGDWVLN